jgi:aromatic-L-amino-acid decarboxylase
VLRSFGVEGLQAMIRRHIAAAQRLDAWLRTDDRFEVIAPTPVGLVSFLHVDGDEATDALVARLNDAGFAINGSVANGRHFIRVSIGSTWTEDRHVDALRSAIDRLG